jgi:AcrR family transcriptional regulator
MTPPGGPRSKAAAAPRGRLRLPPAERKRIASAGAAARWGKNQDAAPEAGPYAELEPREAILLAATRVFARKGFDDPTMRDIATAAGVGLQTIYRCYPTKRALYVECCGALLERYMTYFQDLLASNESPETKIYSFALGMSETHINPDLTRLIHRELLDPLSDTIDMAFGAQMKPYFDHYFAIARDLRLGNVEDKIIALVTLIMGIVQLVPVRRNVPEIDIRAGGIEQVAAFALRTAFPGFDWESVRPETVFFPFPTL